MPTVLTKAMQGDAVSLAQALVATPSVNPGLENTGSGEKEIASLVAGWLDEWGASVQVSEPAPDRYNVLGYIGEESPEKILLLNGHLDTVGVEGMTIDPFGAQLEGGKLRGRGSCDMKGGVAAILSAAFFLAQNKPEHGAVCGALTADEEHASVGMQGLLENGLRADGAIVCEPTNLAIMPSHKGFMWLEVLFTGNAAHGSRPDVGVDAVEHAGQYLSRLTELRESLESRKRHPLLGHASFHAGTIKGGSAPSVYPAVCKLLLERRTLPGEEHNAVMKEFQSILQSMKEENPEINATLRQTLIRSATEVESSSTLVEGLGEACRLLKTDAPIEGMTAWVEASFLNEAGIPAVCFGPGSIGQAHSDDEWVDTREIEQCARVLEVFARDFLERKN